MRGWKSFWVAWIGLWLLPTGIAWACRYTVRDIGFVELRGAEYSLVLSEVDDAAPAGGSFRLPEGWAESLARELGGSNLRWQWGGGQEAGSRVPPEMNRARSVVATLVDRQGRSLELGLWKSRGGAETAAGADDLEQLVRLVFSPGRERMAREGIGAFAHLVVVEGTDRELNERAWAIAQEAGAAIRKVEPMLPRPIAFPVRVERIGLDQRLRDPVLEWSLGGDPADPAKADAAGSPREPMVAVVYGRGRLAGPVMVGDAIGIHETLAQLALVGESCECETDRRWVEERILPHRWTAGDRQRAAASLGFDPESPLVRAEMIRIVSQGVRDAAERAARDAATSERPAGTAAGAIERWLLGYGESELRAYGAESAAAGGAPTIVGAERTEPDGTGQGEVAPGPLSPVKARVIQGDGWDFDEQAEPGTLAATGDGGSESGRGSVTASGESAGEMVDRGGMKAMPSGEGTPEELKRVRPDSGGEASRLVGSWATPIRLSVGGALVAVVLVTGLVARWVGRRAES
ncbi:MAG: hypothetical protein EA381_09225 [Planctomycetaceae bacterium]|nr:MAG: hypothetical protein EA381_09225 [Planctomycetaceae bacterium]